MGVLIPSPEGRRRPTAAERPLATLAPPSYEVVQATGSGLTCAAGEAATRGGGMRGLAAACP